MKLRLCSLLLTVLIPSLIKAQNMQQLNAAEIKQGLEGLNVAGSVLYVAAHPDDENTRLLGYLAKEKRLEPVICR
ncbi:hypothetical protein [Pedobacter steynii]